MTEQDRQLLTALRWVRDNPGNRFAAEAWAPVAVLLCPSDTAWLITSTPRAWHITATGAARLTALEAQESAEHAPSSPRYASGPAGDDLVPRVGDQICYSHDIGGRTWTVYEVSPDVTAQCRVGSCAWAPPASYTLLSRTKPPAPAMDTNDGRGWCRIGDFPAHRLTAQDATLCDPGNTACHADGAEHVPAIRLDAPRCQACEDIYLRRETAPAHKPDVAPTGPNLAHVWLGDGTSHKCAVCGLAYMGWHGDKARYQMDGGIVFDVAEGDLLPPCPGKAPAPTASPAAAPEPPSECPRCHAATRRPALCGVCRETEGMPSGEHNRLAALTTERAVWLTESRRPNHARGRSRLAVLSTPWSPLED